MHLLRVDSSARGHSVTRRITQAFIESWQERHPNEPVTERDLARTALPHITDAWSATFTPDKPLSAEQRQYLALSDELIDELLAADTVVIGAPMYNFSVSWELKAWIDQIVRLGRTVVHGPQGLKGLAGGREVIIVTARGGDYSNRSPRARLDHQEPFLRDIFAFIGIPEIQFIHADRQLSSSAEAVRTEALSVARESAANTASRRSAVP